MGRSSKIRRNERRQRQQFNRDNAVDPRFRDCDEFEYESSYEYGRRVKHQKYPQPLPESNNFIKMNKQVNPKNTSQEFYVDALRTQRVVFGSGSAGSGKTLLAVGVALEKLLTNEVKQIIFTRPTVEAGEELGFLPGDMEDKVLPYMKPMIKSIEYFIGVAACKKLLESEKIVFAPLAFMRGDTMSNCVAILDESQNTTPKQMELFLTRLGFGCHMFITGDPVQSDLKETRNYHGQTGLEWACKIFRGGRTSHVEVIDFSINDVVRDPIMAEMLRAMQSPVNGLQAPETATVMGVYQPNPVPAWRDIEDSIQPQYPTQQSPALFQR